jgi:hypothetical protein
MRRFLTGLLSDEAGSMSVQWAFLVTVLVLGAVTGAILTPPAEPADQDPPRMTAER